ncbi:Cytochrome c oxidase assembly protein COX19 domain protein [Babesia bovis T2Bo]|uniref:CHCH domain containing protein n=1 Tax=Babesia bovis TaxID=5865 RepID=A7ARQ6_BABBO|nr:Cytochrome c oxidase assembly protein COX19 domain protein [Babesia bovis T2Bo]EDO07225.1 Cytochrome c oxidase assembly protein COX19 domain protein [Babesia bovis T2Bo]|eukprot:XP_001610793.1 hypothetical protein [Babesia bovis T2Bo]
MSASHVPRLTAIPPDRGSFPLDHEGLCKDVSERYLRCVKQLRGNAFDCRSLAAEYMKCRIENNLLVEEPLSNFGFREKDIQPCHQESVVNTAVRGNDLIPQRESRKEAQGFIAGEAVVDNYARNQSALSRFLSKFLS